MTTGPTSGLNETCEYIHSGGCEGSFPFLDEGGAGALQGGACGGMFAAAATANTVAITAGIGAVASVTLKPGWPFAKYAIGTFYSAAVTAVGASAAYISMCLL